MTGVAFVAACVAGVLWFLVRQWNGGRGSSQFILRALPATLLLLALPVPQGALEMLRAFETVAATGVGDERLVLSRSAGVLRTLALGHPAFLGTLGCAVFLQIYARSLSAPAAPRLEPDSSDSAVWHARLLVGISLLAVPSAMALVHFQQVLDLILPVAMQEVVPTRPEELSAISASLANGLTLSISFGGVLCAALVVATSFTCLLLRTEPGAKWVTVYSWTAGAAAAVFTVVSVAGLASGFFDIASALR